MNPYFNGSNEDLYDYVFNKDIANAIETTLERFGSWNTKNYSIKEFIELKQEYINVQASKCGLDIEEFQGKLLQKHYRSTQTKLEY